MSVVELKIGTRNFQLACENGEEAHLQKLAGEISHKYENLSRQMRTGNESLLFLMTALMLQDEVNELTKKFDTSNQLLLDEKESEMSDVINTISSYIHNLTEKIEPRKIA